MYELSAERELRKPVVAGFIIESTPQKVATTWLHTKAPASIKTCSTHTHTQQGSVSLSAVREECKDKQHCVRLPTRLSAPKPDEASRRCLHVQGLDQGN